MSDKPEKVYNLKMIADRAGVAPRTAVMWYYRGKLPTPTWILDSGRGKGQALWADYDIEPIFDKIDAGIPAQLWLDS